MTAEIPKLSSELFWMSSAVTALIDVVFVFILTWRIKPKRFRELRWTLVGTAAIFWTGFGFLLVQAFWDAYYQYIFPGWFRTGGILLWVPILYGFFAFGFQWLALRVKGNPILNFCLLAGLEAVLEHLWGFYGLKILDLPFLQQASPVSILAFSFPEYIFYWCVVIGAALLLQNGWSWMNRQRMAANDRHH